MKRFLSILTAVSILAVACVGCNSAASSRRLQTAASGLTSTASVVANEAVSGLSSLISSTTSKLSAKTSGVPKTAASAVAHAAKVIKTAAGSVLTATVKPGKDPSKSIVITPPSPTGTSSGSSKAASSSGAKPVVPQDTGGTPIASSSAPPQSSAASAAQSAVSSSVAVPNDYNVYEYGRSQLTASEAACYDALNSGVQNFNTKVSLPATLTYDEFVKVVVYYLYDHTEVFWIRENISDDGQDEIYIGTTSTSSVKTVDLQFGYSVSTIQQMQAQMRSSAQALLSGVKASMSDYTKAKTIHDNFIRHIKYNMDAVQSPSSCPHSFDAYGALVQQTAVCEGYAKALKILYDAAGLNSLYITGIGVIDSESGSHAWNMVETGGTWHWVDATFDDPVYSYYDGVNTGHETDEYFEMRDSLFQENHIFSEYSESDPENYTDIPDAA